MKYDDAGWHYGGDFPKGSPDKYGATHIALFMKWCFVKGWAGELHTEKEPKELNKVINGNMSAVTFFLDYCDEKLTDEDFNEKGNIFASKYYGDDGLYLTDYVELFGDLMYVASENEHDFEKFSSMLESRYQSNVLTTNDK